MEGAKMQKLEQAAEKEEETAAEVQRLEKEGEKAEETTRSERRDSKGYMLAYYKGKHRAIHDGGGLTSKGRKRLDVREEVRGQRRMELTAKVRNLFLRWILKVESEGQGAKQVYWKLAGNQARESPFEPDMEAYRREVDEKLKQMGLRPERREGDIKTEINFRRMRAVLEAMEDVDYEFLDDIVAKGAPLGVDEELPRTPAVFEEKTSWRRSFTEEVLKDKWSDNYGSAEENAADIERQVNEEVAAGAIIKMPEEEVAAKYKGWRRLGPCRRS